MNHVFLPVDRGRRDNVASGTPVARYLQVGYIVT